jgi:hypothetical protein
MVTIQFQGLLWLPKSRSQKNRQVPVLKVRSQFRSPDINICTNKSGPFIDETEHETGSGTCNHPVSVRKNWLLVKILAGS